MCASLDERARALVQVLLLELLLDVQGLLVGKDLQNDSLQRLYGQLADGQHLAVRKDVKVRHNYLPEVVDPAHVDKCRLHKSAHRKRVDLCEDLAFCRGARVGLSREGRLVEVLEDADCELSECANQLSQALHVEQERAGEERVE